jgi:type IV pilus assembly protein PilC
LKALAVDMPPSRLATAMGRLADHLERGVPLQAAMDMPDLRIPAHLRGVLACGIGSGKLALVLEEFLAHQQLSYELRRRVRSSFAYPVMLMIALALWCWFILAKIVPLMERIFDDFGIELPAITESLLWLSRNGPTIVFYLLAAAALVVLLTRLIAGRRLMSNLFSAMPLFGPLWRDWGLAEFSSLLALLLEHATPLPAALRMTASGLKDPAVADACRRSAQAASEGRSLSDCVVREREFPWALAPIVAWGERLSLLPSALRTAAEMFRARTEFREQFLGVVLPPFTFVFIAMVIGYVVTALFMPLIKLIQTLSK